MSPPGAGFDHETNIVTLYPRDGSETALPRMSKLEVAQRILDAALRLRKTSAGRALPTDASAADAPAADVASLDKLSLDKSSADPSPANTSSTNGPEASRVVPAKTR